MNAILATENPLPSAPASQVADVVLRIRPLPTRVVGAIEPDTLLAAEEDARTDAALAAHRRRVFDSSYLPAPEQRFLIH